jgi:hypothetical protein
MAYKNKTYVCFDADTDIGSYRMMQAWKENENISFNFHNAHELNNLRQNSSEETIKRKLRERMVNSKVAIVLIGNHTKDLFKFVRWEIELALEMGIPIIAVNLNKMKSIDRNLCPPILKDALVMHIAYGQKIINFALNNWAQQHYKEKLKNNSGPFYYKISFYKRLYPNFVDSIYRPDDSLTFMLSE